MRKRLYRTRIKPEISSTILTALLAWLKGVVTASLMACSSQAVAEHLIEVDYWVGPDHQVALYFSEQREFLYFSARKEGACFTFKIPGTWVPDTKERGWFLGTKPDRNLGVLLLTESELERYSGATAVMRAAKFITGLYQKRLDVTSSESSAKLSKFRSARNGAMKWSGVFTNTRKNMQYSAEKVLVELMPGKVAQITTMKPDGSFDDKLAREVLATLSSTSDPDCYWSFLQSHLVLKRPRR